MSLSIWKPLLIDRIHMNISISTDQNSLYSFAWDQLHEIYHMQTELVPNGKITIRQGQSWTRIGYYPQKKTKIADIEVGQRYKHRYFKLSLYPSKFAGDDFSYLKELINGFFPDFNYHKIFFQSHVTYIELACDSLTYLAHSFIPFRKKVNYSKIYLDGSTKGSTYLGSQTSNLRFCIYDKAKQLSEKNQSVPHKLHTRIEARVKKLKLAPAELQLKMTNPFQKLWIADTKVARTLSNDPQWVLFLEVCTNFGSAAALAGLTKSKRETFMKRLFAACASWWKPESRWNRLASALEKIAP